MAFWNRNNNDFRRSRDDDRDAEGRYYRRDEELTGRADRDREREYELRREDERLRHREPIDNRQGFGPRDYREREDQSGRWGGGSYYGDVDYGAGPGAWSERQRM